jgi:large subunit ribosomal protein L22
MAERKRKTEKAETEAKAEEAKDDVAAEEAQAEAAESEQQAEAEAADAPEAEAPDADADEPEAEDADAGEAKPSRRRGSAETAAGSRQRKQAPQVDGEVVVRARARYVRSAPRKARLVMDHIRGRPVEQARAMLTHTPRAISTDILKLLDSAIANAESAYELGADELRVRRAYVDEGPTIKRYRPRALGRATRINKRTSHMTIELTSGEGS